MKTLFIKDRRRALEDIAILAEVARDPFLILDKNLRIIQSNPSFYSTFKVSKKETEGQLVYDLGNRQWNIPKLKTLLMNILPRKKVIKDFEVEHNFQQIGKRVLMLNAKQLDSVKLIILSFEDITIKKEAERRMQAYTKSLEVEVAKQTKALKERIRDLEELTQVMVGRELKMSELKKEIARIKKLKITNGNNGNVPA